MALQNEYLLKFLSRVPAFEPFYTTLLSIWNNPRQAIKVHFRMSLQLSELAKQHSA